MYAWGTNAAGLTTAQTDLGPMVVSQGPDFILNVTPSGSINIPYMGTATINVTATALNGFNGQIDPQLALSAGYSYCFGLIGQPASLTPNSQGEYTQLPRRIGRDLWVPGCSSSASSSATPA